MIFLDPETDRSYNYTQVRNASLDFGKGLKAVWEWKKGDVLALFTPNCIDTPIITWGTLWYVENLNLRAVYLLRVLDLRVIFAETVSALCTSRADFKHRRYVSSLAVY